MGINSSKSQMVSAAPNKTIEMKVKKDSNSNIESISLQRLLDPRSPDVNRTPLPEILTHRFNNCVQNEEVVKTPINQFRKKLLNYSSTDSKLLDPRSPSQFIPRTPLNLSFDESKLASKTEFSLEYTGVIEEASCRNFNERLANITFDDCDIEIDSMSKTKLHEIQEEEDNNEVNNDNAVDKNAETEKILELTSQIKNDPRSPSQSIERTPLVLANAVSKIQNIADDERNISPIINETSDRKANQQQTFSSTPIVQQTGQLKTLLLKKNFARKAEIFKDNEMCDGSVEVVETNLARNKSIEVLITPVKQMAKRKENEKSRTPLGVLNRRSKSVENFTLPQSKCGQQENIILNTYESKVNDENVYFTPQSKPKTSLKKLNSGFKSKIQIHYD